MQYSISCLFKSLGISNTIQIFAGVLGEHKTVFFSQYYTMLTIACEAITQLMLPFQWHHIYIPILPVSLLSFMEAPTPYIIGVHSDHIHELDDFNDVNFVYLDTGEIKITQQV